MPQATPSRTMYAGVILFATGMVFVLIDVMPFLFGAPDRPLWLNLACLAAPAGFALALTEVIRSGRAPQRRAIAEADRL